MGKLAEDLIRRSLRHAHRDQEKEAIAPADQADNSEDTHNLFVFFNIQAVDGEGHAILGLGPIGGPVTTYSYYRHGTAFRGPASVAVQKDPQTFAGIEKASGWITQGSPAAWWNEHLDAALALSCSQKAYEPIKKFADQTLQAPGIYDFITHNCLNFVEDALREGGVEFETHSGHPLHRIAPAKAFEDACGARGAHLYGSWKYWFPVVTAPDNGLRTIPAISE